MENNLEQYETLPGECRRGGRSLLGHGGRSVFFWSGLES